MISHPVLNSTEPTTAVRKWKLVFPFEQTVNHFKALTIVLFKAPNSWHLCNFDLVVVKRLDAELFCFNTLGFHLLYKSRKIYLCHSTSIYVHHEFLDTVASDTTHELDNWLSHAQIIRQPIHTKGLGWVFLGKSQNGFLNPKTDFAFFWQNTKTDHESKVSTLNEDTSDQI